MYVDFLAGIGGIGYFVGSFFFLRSTAYPQLAYFGASFFTYGGAMFLLSGLFMQKRYFTNSKRSEDNLLQEENVNDNV